MCDPPYESSFEKNVFSKKNYDANLNTYKTTQTNETNANPTPVNTATIPYIKGTSETIARILQPQTIHVATTTVTDQR